MSPRHRTSRSSLVAAAVLVVIAAAPLALAQTAKPKKKGGKPAPSASAAPEAAPAPTPEPAPPPPAESANASAADESGAKELPATPPERGWDTSNVRENPNQRYYFFGARYRGNVIPQFLINAAVDGGATIFTNEVGLELDSRKDGFSTVFALSLHNYNTGDLLFHEKGKPQTANNYSVVNSSLNAIYASVDLLWSVPLDVEQHWAFEYGFGAGLGVVFGDLVNNWVWAAGPNGPYYDAASNQHFQRCQSVTDDPACQPANHTNATVAKVGNYKEESGIFGPKPILFPMLNFPQIGLRYKPVKSFEARVGLGFSITGFWFGVSGAYGLEKPEDSETPAPAQAPKKEGAAIPTLQASPGSHGWL